MGLFYYVYVLRFFTRVFIMHREFWNDFIWQLNITYIRNESILECFIAVNMGERNEHGGAMIAKKIDVLDVIDCCFCYTIILCFVLIFLVLYTYRG